MVHGVELAPCTVSPWQPPLALNRLPLMCVLTQNQEREAQLRSQDTELGRLRGVLLEAQAQAGDAEARLQPLTESLELHKHKYQACLSKIGELERSLQAKEEDLKETRAQVRGLSHCLTV